MTDIILKPEEMYLTLGEVSAYVQRTPQAISGHRRAGLLQVTGRRVRLDHFCKYLAQKYPLLPRPSVESLDAWREQRRNQAAQAEHDKRGGVPTHAPS